MCTTTKYSVTERRRGHRHPSRRQNGRKSLQQREGGDHASCGCCPRLYHHSDRLSSSTAGQTTGRSKTLPTPAPVPAIPAELHQRIDCLPEARGKFMKLTKEECERRNCVFVQEQSNQSCVYPDNSEYGYSVVQETITLSATRYYLRKRGKSPFTSPDFKEPVVVVEERGDNLVRIKVIYLCNSLGVVGGGGYFFGKN